MNTKTFVFSPSSLKEYMHCGIKFKFNRVDKVEKTEVSSHHRWFGTLVHSLIYSSAANPSDSMKTIALTGKINDKYPMKIFESVWNMKNSEDPFVQTIQGELGEKPTGKFMRGKTVPLGVSDDKISQAKLEKAWKAEAKKMVKNGVSILKEIPEILEIERKLFWVFQGRKFLGYADVLAKDKDGLFTFYDFKTSWDKPGKRLEEDIQFFFYSHAIKEYYKLNYYPVGYYVHLRSGDAIPYRVTEETLRSVDKKIKAAFSNMESGIFFADYGGPLCPYCDFRHICYGGDENVWRTPRFGG